jgi:hypothetical protein
VVFLIARFKVAQSGCLIARLRVGAETAGQDHTI